MTNIITQDFLDYKLAADNHQLIRVIYGRPIEPKLWNAVKAAGGWWHRDADSFGLPPSTFRDLYPFADLTAGGKDFCRVFSQGWWTVPRPDSASFDTGNYRLTMKWNGNNAPFQFFLNIWLEGYISWLIFEKQRDRVSVRHIVLYVKKGVME